MRTRIELRVVILKNVEDRAEAESEADAIRELLNKRKVYNETLVDDDEEGEV